MTGRLTTTEVRLPSNEEPVAAVTILDGNGSIVRIVPATEFRRATTGPFDRGRGAQPRGPRPVVPVAPGGVPPRP